jgi:hypothetical protein
MRIAFPDARSFRIALPAALLLLLSACGGGGGGSGGGGGRPDTSQLEQKLLDNVNLVTEGQARFTEFKETRCEKTDEMGGAEEWAERFEGEIEFGGPCEYFMQERAKGDRVRFEATTNFLKDDQGVWHQEPLGIYEL